MNKSDLALFNFILGYLVKLYRVNIKNENYEGGGSLDLTLEIENLDTGEQITKLCNMTCILFMSMRDAGKYKGVGFKQSLYFL